MKAPSRTPRELIEHVENLKSSVQLTLKSIKANHDGDLAHVRKILKRAGGHVSPTAEPSSRPEANLQPIQTPPPRSSVPSTATVGESTLESARRVRQLIHSREATAATDFELVKAKEAVDQARRVRSPEEVQKGLEEMAARMNALTRAQATPPPRPLGLTEVASPPRDLFSVQSSPVQGSRSSSVSPPPAAAADATETEAGPSGAMERLAELALAEGVATEATLDWANVRKSIQAISQVHQGSQSPVPATASPPVVAPTELSFSVSFSELDRNGDGVIGAREGNAAVAAIETVNHQEQPQMQQQQVPQQQQPPEPVTTLPSGGPNTLQERLHQFRAERTLYEPPVGLLPGFQAGEGTIVNPDASIHHRLAQLRESLA